VGEQNLALDFEFGALEHAQNYRRALINELAPYLRGRVLEVGAGVGQITSELLQIPTITKLVSVEPNPKYCEVLMRKFPGHEIVQGTIENVGADSLWDCIVSINVLEHIQDDVGELRRYYKRLVESRGVLCLFVPARQELYSNIDRDFGHFRRYSRSELREKLNLAGFTRVHMRYYNLIGYFAWFFSFRILKIRRFSSRGVWVFDRFIFPVTNWFETRIWHPPIGQSLLAVAHTD